MAFACRKLGYDVYVTDKEKIALDRMKKKYFQKDTENGTII